MKRKFALLNLFLLLSFTSFCTNWTVTNSGNNFSPATLTITFGESVVFNIASIHNVKEVSQSVWNANGNSPLSGGFQLGFGGGTLTSSQLTVGTHYYVCSPHASSGMKGTIIVQNISTGIEENQLQSELIISPNPSHGKFNLIISEVKFIENSKLIVYNLQGKEIYQSLISNPKSEINISDQKKGIYFIKIHIGEAIILKKIIVQ